MLCGKVAYAMATRNIIIKSSLGSAIGATVTLQLGSVPSVVVDLRPSGNTFKIIGGGSFPDIDSRRRITEETLDIAAVIRTGAGAEVSRKFSFKGLLDGYSVGNVVGSNSYQAVLKHKAQTMLELGTLTPGLYPSSVNVYRIASHALTTKSQGDDAESVVLWNNFLVKYPDLHKLPPIKFYVNLLQKIAESQLNGDWETNAGKDKMISGQTAFKDIFSSEAYRRNLKTAIEILKNVNYDACSGTIDQLSLKNSYITTGLKNFFTQGPNIFLENLLNYLASVGCTMVFGNDTASYIVPINSVIKQKKYKPGVGQLSTEVNKAGPADYNSYVFSDVGFRDINSVILLSPGYVGGPSVGGFGFDNAQLASYTAPESEAKGSGIYTVRAHPWMYASPISPTGPDAKQGKANMDSENSPYSKKITFEEASTETAKSTAERAQAKAQQIANTQQKILMNFAETKYYQARFTDRQGTITMDFNPNWVPGAGGILYVRETEMYLHFFVDTVTHHVETNAPNVGSAITSVHFSCGRFGKDPVGGTQDLFLGYNADIEEKLRTAYAKTFQS